MTSTTLLGRATANEARAEVFREAVTMVLYVSVVEIAELAAIPRATTPTVASPARSVGNSSRLSGALRSRSVF